MYDKLFTVIFPDRTIKNAFGEYFKECTGYNPDEITWSVDGMTLTASHKLTKDEVKKEFGDIKIGIWEIDKD